MREQTDYRNFGLDYVAGRRVMHLNSGSTIKTVCGHHRMQLKVSPNNGIALCKKCKRGVKIKRFYGTRVAFYRSPEKGKVTAYQEKEI